LSRQQYQRVVVGYRDIFEATGGEIPYCDETARIVLFILG
jgi:hypothetical protein